MKRIGFKKGKLPSKYYCSECGDEFYEGSEFFYYADEDPYTNEFDFVFCSKSCLKSNAKQAGLEVTP